MKFKPGTVAKPARKEAFLAGKVLSYRSDRARGIEGSISRKITKALQTASQKTGTFRSK